MPLSKIVVQMYGVLIEVSLWIVMLGALIGGWQTKGFFGAIISAAVAAVLAAVFFGAFLVLNDIRDRVKKIEMAKSS